MKRYYLQVIILICVLFFSVQTNVLAGDFEGTWGFGAGGNNYGGFSINTWLNLGYTSADMEINSRRATEAHERGLGVSAGSLMRVKEKVVDNYDFDILFNLTAGLPFVQAGGLFNFYFLTPSIFALGVGLGGGYAIGYLGNESDFAYGPYIRAAIPLLLNGSGVGLNIAFDYFFFEKGYIQIGFNFSFVYF